MAKISGAGASDQNVDPDYIAPPGMAPQDAIERDIPDAGQGGEPTPVDEPAQGKSASWPRKSATKKSTDKQ